MGLLLKICLMALAINISIADIANTSTVADNQFENYAANTFNFPVIKDAQVGALNDVALTAHEFGHWMHQQGVAFASWYAENRSKIISATQWAQGLRDSETYSIALLLLFGSVLLWGRDNIKQLRELFSRLVKRDPVPFNRHIGVKLDYLVIVRQIIFYSCLYILYELVSRFLAFRNSSGVAFYSNVIFRACLIVLLLRAHWTLRAGISDQDTLSDDKQQTLKQWFDEHFEKLNVSAKRVRRLAISLFILTIAPSIVLHVPQILDFVVSL